MDKLRMHSPNLTEENVAKIAALFPNCVTEGRDEKGNLKRVVDFDLLRQELSPSLVEGPQERYRLDWPGKREALLAANAPIAKTLRPCREESVDFDTTRNLFIEGDNLDALKLLQETYLGKVKMIYIDPPYNTGNDFIYEDDFAEDTQAYLERSNQKDEVGNRMVANTASNGRLHSDWLSMMHSRLRVARNLLAEDGLIIVSIDSHEAANLRILMDEVFGTGNFVGLLPTVMNLKGNNDAFAFSDTHEFTLVYAKSKYHCKVNPLPVDEDDMVEWSEDDRGYFKRADTLRRTGQDASRERRPNGWFPVFITSDLNVYVTADDKPKSASDTELWPRHENGEELSWTWSKQKISDEPFNLMAVQGRNGINIYKKQRPGLGDLPSYKPKSILYKPEYSSSNGTAEVGELLGRYVFDSPPKPRALLRDLITIGTGDGDIIMDFFAGTGTTAHATMALNALTGTKRKHILVQLNAACDPNSRAFQAGYKTISQITKERVRLAGKEILRGPHSDSWDRDIGFRVLKIDVSNMEPVFYSPDEVSQSSLLSHIDNVREGRTPEDLLFQALLESGIAEALTLPIKRENLSGKEVFFVDGDVLAACFEGGLDDDFIKALAARKPMRAVFRDNGFASSAAKINAEQIFKQISPNTELKVI